MSIMCWNCQGLGTYEDLTIPRLKKMPKEYFHEILFLMETMNRRDVLVDLQEWLGYDRVFTINPIGRRGGLAVFWKKSVDIVFHFVDKNLVDFQVQFGAFNYFVWSLWSSCCVR